MTGSLIVYSEMSTANSAPQNAFKYLSAKEVWIYFAFNVASTTFIAFQPPSCLFYSTLIFMFF